MHRAVSDDSIDVLKLIESGLRTPGLVHRLLVVSTVCVIFGFLLILVFFLSFLTLLAMFYLNADNHVSWLVFRN